MSGATTRSICLIALVALLAVPASSFAKSIRDIVKENADAVALVLAFDKKKKVLGSGSGFFVQSDGILVTNFHVIRNASSYSVRIFNGAVFSVTDILAVDKNGDIAVLKVRGKRLPTVKLADSSAVNSGDAVVAIGHPLGLEISFEMDIETTTTEGIVSTVRTVKETGRKVLQISAPISSGSSGGLLLNMQGEAVGMTRSTITKGQNINFAVPIDQIKDAVFATREPGRLTESANLFYLKGVLADDKMDYETAEHFYKKALEKDPAHVDAHIGLGGVYFTRKRYDLQLKHFKEAVRIDPDNVNAHYFLATAYEDKGLFDLAMAEYEAVLRINPTEMETLFTLGVLYLAERKTAEARKMYRSLEKLNPGLALKLKKLLDAVKQ